MHISTWYSTYFESRLKGRYVTSNHIQPLLETANDLFEISEIGESENGLKIQCVKFGKGKKVVLAWSQMHGNESTTTKAIFDLFKFFGQKEYLGNEIQSFLETHTCYFIPILNPDGAAAYTRENANGIDLNRDAHKQSQAESRILLKLFEMVQPDLCLNLHDQRTMYSLPGAKSATISFLAPAADAKRTVTAARSAAMRQIEQMYGYLSTMLPGQIGRYDDTFNSDCVGDTFQQRGVPTILFEAGHYQNDYQREQTRAYIFYAMLNLFGVLKNKQEPNISYDEIPENGKMFKDVILRNVVIDKKTTDVAINYKETLEEGRIKFVPILEKIGELEHFFGHQEIEGKGAYILLNSYENVFEGEEIATIVDKNSDIVLFSCD
jgi:predicted deacylase